MFFALFTFTLKRMKSMKSFRMRYILRTSITEPILFLYFIFSILTDNRVCGPAFRRHQLNALKLSSNFIGGAWIWISLLSITRFDWFLFKCYSSSFVVLFSLCSIQFHFVAIAFYPSHAGRLWPSWDKSDAYGPSQQPSVVFRNLALVFRCFGRRWNQYWAPPVDYLK